jgi:hypothetical protein
MAAGASPEPALYGGEMAHEMLVDVCIDISMVAGVDGNAVEVVGLIGGRLERRSIDSCNDVSRWWLSRLAGSQHAGDQQHEYRNQSAHILSLIVADDTKRKCTRV